MVRFFDNYPLKSHNTFGIESIARYFFEFTEPEDLPSFFQSKKYHKDLPVLILGGGSNILFLKNYVGLIIHPEIPGIRIVNEDRQYIWIESGAGEVWDEFVMYCVNNGFGGLENLSLIPGNVGASPVQNIGAYGQEAANVIDLVRGYDIESGSVKEFFPDECGFAYRDSVFKRKLKNKFIITSVVFKLDKFPHYNLSYGKVEEQVKSIGEINLKNIREAIIDIRSSKLPDVNEIGNAGSFFKNPVVEVEVATRIKSLYPSLPVYPAGEGFAKLAAGWLIDQAGWKGRRVGNAGVYDKQALVLVNYGNATGEEIYNLSADIIKSVNDKFGIRLECEVNCI